MQTSLLHELVVGTPIISATCDPLQKSVNRYLPDPATQCQYPTTTSKQSRVYLVKNKLARKANNSLSQGVQEHVRLGTNISETIKRKLSLGARILQVGGVEKVFKQYFSVKEGEKLLKASLCYLSTTSGPLAGFSSSPMTRVTDLAARILWMNAVNARVHHLVPALLQNPSHIYSVAGNAKDPTASADGIHPFIHLGTGLF
ncbi:putative GEM-like protein 8 [Sesbania bispinosa]|nr:putative GEM-like protein 8 [Sesbania bispinosa]